MMNLGRGDHIPHLAVLKTVPVEEEFRDLPGEGKPQEGVWNCTCPHAGSHNMTDAVLKESVSLSPWQG